MRLDQFLETWHPAGFDWAQSCCAHFVGQWIEARTGTTPLILAVESPKTPLAWSRFVGDHGGVEAAVDAFSGWVRKDPGLVQQGDIILTEGSITGWTLGICAGRLAAVLSATGQVVLQEIDVKPLCAWGPPE